MVVKGWGGGGHVCGGNKGWWGQGDEVMGGGRGQEVR